MTSEDERGLIPTKAEVDSWRGRWEHNPELPRRIIEVLRVGDGTCLSEAVGQARLGEVIAFIDACDWPETVSFEHCQDSSDFPVADLRGLDLADKNLDGIFLRSALLQGASFMRSYINGGCLERADLSGADLRHVVANKADLRRTRLHGCRLDDAELEEAHLDCVNMKNGSLSNARMARAGIAGSVIEVVDLSRAELVKARLNDSLLREISGPEVNFEGSILDGACFEGCKLPGARFRKARGRASFLACNLESCNGKEAKIAGSSFEGSSLVRAKFPKADLSGGSLVSADLSGGDFTEANLSNVDWRMPVSVEGLQIWGARFANRRDFEKHIRDEQWLSEFRESARFSRNPVLWAWRILWFLSSNYGRSPSVLFLWAVLFILGFAVVYHGVNYGGFLPPGPGWATWPVPADKAVVLVGQGKGLSPFLESVHLSVDIFTNLGVSRVEALTPLGACLVWTEALIGWITLGSLLSVIANIVLRRS